MNLRDRLITILADGRLHSGGALASALGVTRSAVWKQVHQLGSLGMEVVAEAGRGYRLASSLELLDRDVIHQHLDAEARAACQSLEIAPVLQSTSSTLAAQPAPAAGLWQGALAEFQTGGRGRRGRRWLSSFGSGLCLSMSWSFPSAPRDLAALSLAAGVAARRALASLGAASVSLKWPNDVVADGAKLAGILVDVDGEARGPLRAIIGIGVNLSAPERLVRAVIAEGGLAPGAIDSDCPGAGRVGRNALAAALFTALFRVLRDYPAQGFGPLADEWRRNDYLRGRRVVVSGGPQVIDGTACGISPQGALLVDGPEGRAEVMNGDITLRTSP